MSSKHSDHRRNSPLGWIESSTMALTGISYFMKHPNLWLFFLSIIIPYLIVTSSIFMTMLCTVWVIQLLLSMFMTLMGNPLGPLFAWMNFLHQVDMVSHLIASQLVYKMPLQLLFDAVLEQRGFDNVVLRGKYTRPAGKKLDILEESKLWLWDLPHNIINYPLIAINALLTVVFTVIPYIGPVIIVFMNAPSRGFQFHKRYYDLKGIDERQRTNFYKARRFEYIAFGIVTGILQQIPFISLFFQFTSVVGAALWAAEEESRFARLRQGLLINELKIHPN